MIYILLFLFFTSVSGIEFGSFPMNSVVSTPNGYKLIQYLNVGDQITIYQNGELVNDSIVDFIFINDNVTKQYHFITHPYGNLIISEKHQILVCDKYKYSKDLSLNDQLLFVDHNKNYTMNVPIISNVVHHSFGAFSPLTRSGLIIVNNILMSCYHEIDPFYFNIVTTPQRYNLTSKNKSGLHFWISWLFYIWDFL
jgi:hypothetical protein